jgi:hypothetical protein
MSIATFSTIRDSAIEQMKAAFAGYGGKLHIAAHPGRFDEAEIKRLASRAPAVLTSFMRYTDEDLTIDFASWVVCRASGTDRLYDGALNLVSALVPVIRGLDCDWCMDAPDGIEAECLYSGTLDQINATLWGVKWRWKIRETALGNGEGGVPVFDLEDFEGYDAAHHLGSAAVNDNVDMEVYHGNTTDANP